MAPVRASTGGEGEEGLLAVLSLPSIPRDQIWGVRLRSGLRRAGLRSSLRRVGRWLGREHGTCGAWGDGQAGGMGLVRWCAESGNGRGQEAGAAWRRGQDLDGHLLHR